MRPHSSLLCILEAVKDALEAEGDVFLLVVLEAEGVAITRITLLLITLILILLHRRNLKHGVSKPSNVE